MVAGKTFREDLYYRLAVVRVELPPLRERLEDIEGIVASLLEGTPSCRGVRLSPEALEALSRHSWPGNVRELRNVLERDAENPQALWFVGISEAVAGNNKAARELWQRLLELLPEDNEDRQAVERALDTL